MDKLQHSGEFLEKPTTLPGDLNRDFDLALEEKLAAVVAERDNLKKRCADYITRLDNLQMSRDDLREKNNVVEEQLSTLRDANSSAQGEQTINNQKLHIIELESIIARHEEELELKRIKEVNQEKELNSLRRSAEKLTSLDDEVRTLRVENASLTKKANMIDHYQKKLESQSGLDKENQKLREKLSTLEYLEKDYDEVHDKNKVLDNTIAEYSKMFQQYEVDILEGKRLNNTLFSNLQKREEEAERLQNTIAHDEVLVKELQDQLASVGVAPASPTTSAHGDGGHLTLEDELEQTVDSPRPNLQLENSRLKAENKLLKAGPSNAILQTQLETLNKDYRRVVENLQEAIEKDALSQEQILLLLESVPSDKLVFSVDRLRKINPDFKILTRDFHRDTALRKLRDSYQQVTEDLTTTKKKLIETEAELSKCSRELLDVKTDCKKQPRPLSLT